MAQQREDIRAQCGRLGVEVVQQHLDNGTYFNNEKEAGWGREWLKEQLRIERQENREDESLELARRADRKAMIAIIVSIVSAVIAFVAVILEQS
jgi:hypothetical protein